MSYRELNDAAKSRPGDQASERLQSGWIQDEDRGGQHQSKRIDQHLWTYEGFADYVLTSF